MILAIDNQRLPVQQLIFSIGLVVILLAGVALAGDLGNTRHKKTYRNTVNNSLESQWRTPLSNQNSWREGGTNKKGAERTFDNYDPEDLDKFRTNKSYGNNLQYDNPTMFGLKLKF